MRKRTDNAEALSVLLLCDDRHDHAANVREHIAALRRMSRHRVEIFNPRGTVRSRFLDLHRFDVVVVHYTLVITHDAYLAPWFRERIAAFEGLKVQFIQDEYRWVDSVTETMRELGIDLLYSLVPQDVVPTIYGPRLPHVEVKTTLAGFVPSGLATRPATPLAERPLDVVYRGRAVPYWLGRLAQEKVEIGSRFLALARGRGLQCDIAWAEIDRVYGEDWYRLLGSARATLGTESGASIVDFDGSVERRTNAYLDAHPAASFEEVERELLAPYEGNARIEVVSPRVLEAAALRTAMINFEGRYSGVIEPWRHYVPLAKDFSNFEEVLDALGNGPLLQRLTRQAHDDLVGSGAFSLRGFVSQLDDDFEARVATRLAPARKRLGRRSLLALETRVSPSGIRREKLRKRARGLAFDRVTRTLVRQEPEVSALTDVAMAECGSSPIRRRRVLQDLVRLAVLVAANRRTLRHVGQPFTARPLVEDEGRTLSLVSSTDHACVHWPTDEWGGVQARIASGELEALVWRHSPVGLSVMFPFGPRFMTLEVGYYATYGNYRFTYLEQLAKRCPDDVSTALAPLFETPQMVVADGLTPEPPTGLVRRLLVGTRVTPTRGLAALRAVLTNESLRTLFLLYLRERNARRSIGTAGVLEDLLKLRLLYDATTLVRMPGRPQVQLDVALDSQRRVLRYSTTLTPNDSLPAPLKPNLAADDVAVLKRILWDNSAISDRVECRVRPRVSVGLGESGIHEFRALAMLAAAFPDETLDALLIDG
jgi:hypothetical protein